MEDALQIEHFSKRYNGFTAVDDISLNIARGEFFGFLGPNGAGKTTTINCVTGIGKFTEGTIRVFGIDVRRAYREARAKVGLSPQEFNIDIFAPVKKILWYMSGYYGMPRPLRVKRIDEMIRRFELTEHADKPFRALSGGLKRRVMLARAMVHDPELLILDEPTAGLDVELRHELWQYLRELNRAGKTILLTSHYLEEIELLCGRVAIIHQGKIVKSGAKEEFSGNGKTLEQVYLGLTGHTHAH